MRRLHLYIALFSLASALGLAALGLFVASPVAVAQAASLDGLTPTRAETVTIAITDIATVTFAEPVEYVAAYWPGAEDAQVTLAFSSDGAYFGPPIDAGRDDAEGDPAEGVTYGAVRVAGGATVVRITTDTPLAELNLIGMTPPSDAYPVAVATPLPAATASAAAESGQPTVISRAAWGAEPSYLNWSPQFYPASKVVIHHTADPESPSGTQASYAARVRSIYYYHAVTRDWGDIAYNFLIDPLGNIYEGRYTDNDPSTPPGEDAYGNGVRGGHAYNYNTATVGIAVLGTYSSKDISAAARASLVELLAWVVERQGIDPLGFGVYTSPFQGIPSVQTWNITGHRDYGSTDCPGTAFYNSLPSIREEVAALTGPVAAPQPCPTYIKLSTSPSPAIVGQKVTVSATLIEDSSRTPVFGRKISFATGGIAGAQTSVGTAITGADGVASAQMTFTAAGTRWISARFDPGADSAYRGATTSTQVIPAPAGLSASSAAGRVQLTWDAVPQARGYNVYRNGVMLTSLEPLTSTGYLDTGLTNGVVYSYQVTAIADAEGRESAKSPAVAVVTSGDHFLDVVVDHPYYTAILDLAGAGVVNGYEDGTFGPDESVMRQQFAKMIVLGCGYDVSESDLCSFGDVFKSDVTSLYPDNFVAVCADCGITVGRTPTRFFPYDPITRAQVATMVVRAAQDYKPSAVVEPPSGWDGELPAGDPDHGENIALAEYNGLLDGIDLFGFTVTKPATRGEIAQIIYNLRRK